MKYLASLLLFFIPFIQLQAQYFNDGSEDSQMDDPITWEASVEKENDSTTILPSIQLWHPASGWQASLGGEVPISSYKNNDFQIHFQIRNHLDWGRWLQ